MENNCPNHGETNLKIENIQKVVDESNADVREVVRAIAEVKQNIALVTASMKSFHKRMDGIETRTKELEDDNQEIIVLANSIDRLANSISINNGTLDEHKDLLQKLTDRVITIENSAGKYALKMWQIVAGLLLTGVVGFVMAHFGFGG